MSTSNRDLLMHILDEASFLLKDTSDKTKEQVIWDIFENKLPALKESVEGILSSSE